jgi:hypothetical protein
MKSLILLLLLLVLISPGQSQTDTSPNDGSSVAVLSYKWTKSRQTARQQEPDNNTPASMMIQSDKNFERNRKINNQAGVRDPQEDTVDGRRAALEKSVQEARTPKAKDLDGFAYSVKVRNTNSRVIEVIFWEYQFTESANPGNVVRRQFLCGVNIKPDKEKELQAFSLSGPSNVISVGSLNNKSNNLFQERAVINRVEYADGTIWQRKDWSFAEVKQGVARATSTPWGADMCRSL